jgi:hypothetical protein
MCPLVVYRFDQSGVRIISILLNESYGIPSAVYVKDVYKLLGNFYRGHPELVESRMARSTQCPMILVPRLQATSAAPILTPGTYLQACPCAPIFPTCFCLEISKMYAQRQLAYAPTPYSYTPTSTLSATINLDEVRPARPPTHLPLTERRKSNSRLPAPTETFTNLSPRSTASSSPWMDSRKHTSRTRSKKANILRHVAAC